MDFSKLDNDLTPKLYLGWESELDEPQELTAQ
jgi:hypothetical protein